MGKGAKGEGSSSAASEAVKVVVRCRPLSQKEVDEGRQRIVDVDPKTGNMSVRNPKAGGGEPPKSFTFDLVYDWNCHQANLYEEVGAPIVDNVMEGYNGTIFAYGQTGTGKTHTMEGQFNDPEQMGIIPRSFKHVFESISGLGNDKEYLVRASFLEIYNEDIRDLLSKNPNNKLELKETPDTGVYVKDLTSFVVKGVNEINNVLAVGKKNRTVGATLMNQDSSRSHSIFTVTVETSDKGGDDPHIRVGKLNLVDLAGSERQSKTGATGDRLKEATKINLSLSALGNVISALVDGKSQHIPYRDSKLTRLLQDSLGGNTKTVMCANVGPADYNFDETISTLRYANRAKNIKNKPKINEDPKDAMLREFQEEIAKLKAQLAAGGRAAGGGDGGDDSFYDEEEEAAAEEAAALDDKEISAIKAQVRKELEEKMRASVTEDAMMQAKEEAEKKAQEEMQAILEDKQKTAEEKEKIRESMKKHEEQLQAQFDAFQKEKQARKALAKKLKAMEEKLVVGGEEQDVHKLVEQRKIREAELAKKAEQLAEQRQKEMELEAKIKAKEDDQLNVEGDYSSLQEEADAKSRKLNKLVTKYQGIHQEIQEIAEEQQREREDMLDTLRTLTRQMKLKDLIISSFIPREEMEKVKKRAVYDEQHEMWMLEALAEKSSKMQRPVSAGQSKRPVTDYAKIASAMGDQVGGSNPRFKSENILNLELDMPERTTYDYEGPGKNARVQAAINAAFSDDSEMLFISSDNGTIGNVMMHGGNFRRLKMWMDEHLESSKLARAMWKDNGPPAARVRPGSARRTTQGAAGAGAEQTRRSSQSLGMAEEAPKARRPSSGRTTQGAAGAGAEQTRRSSQSLGMAEEAPKARRPSSASRRRSSISDKPAQEKEAEEEFPTARTRGANRRNSMISDR